ncbi:MAG: hypothetical protein IT324_22990 [Anaerolineae bacterium]|nr:hypothetical protein [Anaerolineae bacterium]
MSNPDTPLPGDAVLSAFGEVVLLLDAARCIRYVAGAAESFLHIPVNELAGLHWSALLAHADSQARNGLYWAVESLLEGYVLPRFLPARLPFTRECSAQIAKLTGGNVAVRFQPNPFPALDALFGTSLRLSLTSITGFADVLLKGIGGPLTDIQIDDLNVIARSGQFALRLIEDLRAQMITPALSAPIPVHARVLLELGPDDVSYKRLTSQNLTLYYDLPDRLVYSNGAIRAALIWLVQTLMQTTQQCTLMIAGSAADDVLEVAVTYQPASMDMTAIRRVDPIDLFDRQAIKQAAHLLTVVASLHAALTPYGCTAWAFPADSGESCTIVMTVPIWKGPTNPPSL